MLIYKYCFVKLQLLRILTNYNYYLSFIEKRQVIVIYKTTTDMNMFIIDDHPLTVDIYESIILKELSHYNPYIVKSYTCKDAL